MYTKYFNNFSYPRPPPALPTSSPSSHIFTIIMPPYFFNNPLIFDYLIIILFLCRQPQVLYVHECNIWLCPETLFHPVLLDLTYCNLFSHFSMLLHDSCSWDMCCLVICQLDMNFSDLRNCLN